MSFTTKASGVTLLLLIVGAVLIPILGGTGPSEIGDVLATRLVPPLGVDSLGQFHLLGTDRFGRDMLARVMQAARISLAVGVAGSLFGALVGTIIGAVAAWAGGWIDRLLMGISDALLSMPRLVLLLVCSALWSPGIVVVVLVLVFTGWMGVARMVRAEVLGVRALPYVDAAVSLGASSPRTLMRHALPNAVGPAIVAATLGVGNTILLEGGLSFLGLGIQPPAASWGNMIAGGRDLIITAPWIAITPGIVLVITVLCCTLLGDALRDKLAGAGPTNLADRA